MPKRTGRHRKSSSFSIYNLSFTPWAICLIAVIFYAYDYLLRVQPSIMVHDLMHFFGTDATGVGFLSAFYFYAYTPLQIPAGLIVDRYSMRVVLTVSAFLCVLGAALFGFVENYYVALIARMLMGIGSAFAFVGALKLASLWLPQKHFALFSGITAGVGTIGAISTDIILSRMMVHFGWQKTVLITAYVGFVIAIIIWLFVRDKPKHVKPLPREFKNWSHAWHRLLFITKQWRFWVNGIVGAALYIPINVFASLWGSTFIKRVYNLTNQQSATSISLVFLGLVVGGPLFGWVSDYIKSRKIPAFVGCGLSILLTFAILYVTDMSQLTLFIMLFLLGVSSGSHIMAFSIAREISPPRSTGTATATTNFIVTLGAGILQPLIGYLLVKFWQGSLSAKGAPIYSIETYRHALLIMPIFLTVAFFLIFLIPETHCKLKYKHIKKHYS